MNLLKLGKYSCVLILSEWLSVEDFVRLESAFNKNERKVFLQWIREYSTRFSRLIFTPESKYPIEVVSWAKNRGLVGQGNVFMTNRWLQQEYTASRSLSGITLQCNNIKDINHSLLKTAIISCKDLEELYTDCLRLEVDLFPIFANSYQLRVLDISRCARLSETTVAILCRNCVALESLRMRKASWSDSSWFALMVHCRKLEHFNFTSVTSWKRSAMLAFHSSRCWKSSPAVFKKYLLGYACFMQYRGSALTHCTIEFTSTSLAVVLPTICPLLTSLNLNCNFSIVGMQFIEQQLGGLIHLRCLKFYLGDDFEYDFVDVSGFDAVLQQLEVFEFSDGFAPLIDSILSHCTSLTALKADRLDHALYYLPALADMPNLSELAIDYSSWFGHTNFIRNLSKFSLKSCNLFTIDHLQTVCKNCPLLREMHLNYCPRINDDGVLILVSNCELLNKISLQMCENTMRSMNCIAELCRENLRELKFSCIDALNVDMIRELVINAKRLRVLSVLRKESDDLKRIEGLRDELNDSYPNLLFTNKFNYRLK